MNYYRFPENRITKAAMGLYLFVLLYLCRDSMFCLSVVGFYPSQAITLGLTAVLGIVFLVYNRRRIGQILRDGRMVLVLVVTAAVLIPMVGKGDWTFMYFSILFYLYIAILLSFFLTWREAAKYYVLILTALGVYSVLAAYVFRIPIDMGIVEMDVFRDGRGVGIYNFIFSVVPRSFEKNRNFGIFREPGVYQYFILLALVMTHYGVQWKKSWTKWILTAVLSVVMLSTLATGGVAELGLLAVFVFFEQKLYRNKVLVAIVLVLLLIAGTYLYHCYDYYTPLWQQIEMMFINKFTRQEDSVTERTEAIFVNLEMMMKHPVLGATFEDVLHSVANNTSSSLILLAAFGVVFGSLHILAWTALLWSKERSILANLVLMGIMFLSFNTQNLSWDVFFWLLPVMALAEKAVPVIQKRFRKGNV